MPIEQDDVFQYDFSSSRVPEIDESVVHLLTCWLAIAQMIHDVHEVSTREVFRLTGPESLSTHYVSLSRVHAQAPILHGTADDALRVSVRHDARGEALTDIFDKLSFKTLAQGVVALDAFLYLVEGTWLPFV